MEPNLSLAAAGLGGGNASGGPEGGGGHLLLTAAFGTLLSCMYVAGVAGNVYTLAVMCHSARCAAPMYSSIVSLALADLLYLSTIPFVVCTYLAQDWYFGDLGCRLLLSLDLLTMHASIFTLTLMCAERYLAVTRPLDTLKRSQGYRKATAGAVWSVSLLLTLPMMLMVTLSEGGKAGGRVKRMCAPTWSVDAYRTYLTVLFSTSIMAPGIIIGYLYTRLARTYLESQRNPPHKENKRSPRQKVLIMIFTIVLVFWACFLPFWIWQLVRLYNSSLQLTLQTQKCINYLVTCLTYSNSCINPFLYTLLTKNYREYLRNRHRNFYKFTSSFRKRGSNLQCSWGRSMSSSNQYDCGSESLGMATMKDK
ncbi:PREDICTED: urotensin-2 receptor-like [Gavialis gangeticus]|uniref:urotensin-2 receptor-like n=1 Tax=Gavialis gangeticus TaxID=94835 RepID=UPI00092FC61B|nr:PREDICTED: urotensin-2 receptor-like [Gavialis gangeticus]